MAHDNSADTVVPRKGTGAFQWNKWGWFGAQIGSSLWLLILAIAFLWISMPIALWWLLCFLIPNIISFTLWRRRDRLDPYVALQTSVAVLGVATFLALLGTDLSGIIPRIDPRYDHLGYFYLLLLMFPWLMAMFYFQNRAGRR